MVKNIEAKTITILAGFEVGDEGEVAYLPDTLFEYIGYAPNDWIEFDIGGYYLFMVPMVEAKIDLAELLLKTEKLSADADYRNRPGL
jgi:hypothetical protein